MKQKKITVKFFLNKKGTKSIDYHPDTVFPVYVQVTFNRKTTYFPFSVLSNDAYNDLMTESDFAEEQKKMKSLLINVEKIIRYEINKTGEDKFELKGLSSKIQFYSIPLFHYVLLFVAFEFREFLKDNLIYRELETIENNFHAPIDFFVNIDSTNNFKLIIHYLSSFNFKDIFDLNEVFNFELQDKLYLIFKLMHFFVHNYKSTFSTKIYDWLILENVQSKLIDYIDEKPGLSEPVDSLLDELGEKEKLKSINSILESLESMDKLEIINYITNLIKTNSRKFY